MIIVSKQQLPELKFGQNLYINPEDLGEESLELNKKFILYYVDDIGEFKAHYELLRKFHNRVILIADYADMETYNLIKDFNAFLMVDRKEGIGVLNKFIAVCGSYISESIQRSLEDCQVQIRDLEGQLEGMSKMIRELSNANVEILVNDWAKD